MQLCAVSYTNLQANYGLITLPCLNDIERKEKQTFKATNSRTINFHLGKHLRQLKIYEKMYQ